MAHAQKPDFVFLRNGRVHLNRRGASVQSTTGSWGVRNSGSNAGCTMFRGSVKGTDYPLHSPVSPSLPILCVTVCHHISTGLYQGYLLAGKDDRCVGLTALPSSYADSLEFGNLNLVEPSGPVQACNGTALEASWNVMAHAQTPDFVFRRNGRVRLNRRGRQFSWLLAVEVCIGGSNAGYTMCEGYWLPTAFVSFSFASLPVLQRVPSHFNWTLYRSRKGSNAVIYFGV